MEVIENRLLYPGLEGAQVFVADARPRPCRFDKARYRRPVENPVFPLAHQSPRTGAPDLRQVRLRQPEPPFFKGVPRLGEPNIRKVIGACTRCQQVFSRFFKIFLTGRGIRG